MRFIKNSTNRSFKGKRTSEINIFEAIVLKQNWTRVNKVIYVLMLIF